MSEITRARAIPGTTKHRVVMSNACSVSEPHGRGLEWKVPLWEAINAATIHLPQERRYRFIADVEGAVHTAMAVAVEVLCDPTQGDDQP